MIKLYQFYPRWNLPNASPFCMKLETYLKIVKAPYENHYSNNMSRAPKGKFPFIEINGELMGDSNLIIEYLKQKGFDADKHLSVEQQAISLAIRGMIEDQLYWKIIYCRWVDHWDTIKKNFFGHLSFPSSFFVPRAVQKYVHKQLWMQGTSRHSKEEIYAMGHEIIHALSILLGKQAFMFGEAASSIDASMHAHLDSILKQPFHCPLRDSIEQHSNLVSYCQRMNQTYYS